MKKNMFMRFSADLKRLGQEGVGALEFCLGKEGKYSLQYIPFEHIAREAKLVIVGITPGNTQLDLAYQAAQELLNTERPEEEILTEVKKVGAFGGKSMKPNLLKLLRHFQFEKLLGIDDVESLWGENAGLLHSTSVVPQAAFKNGKRFNGSFDEVIASRLLKECFLDCFVPAVREINEKALFVALGPCPQAALDWCVKEGALRQEQVLGSFCHPSSAGGSTTRYYLREVTKDQLDPKNPVRSRCDWLDQAYEQMLSSTSTFLDVSFQTPMTVEQIRVPFSEKSVTSTKTAQSTTMKENSHAPTGGELEIEKILKDIERAGYKSTNATKKVAEFQSPGGQFIYVIKTSSNLNNINLMVHPDHKQVTLSSIDGIDSVSDEHRFHSNMTKFPKRINKGETPTAFGWHLNISTLSDLNRFLSSFKSISL